MAELQIVENKERLKSLREMLHQFSAPAAEALIQSQRGGCAMLCLRTSVSGQAGAGWGLPGAI